LDDIAIILFTLAGNILPIYVLPGFSALAVLIALNCQWNKHSNYLALSSLTILACLLVVLSLGLVSKKSEVELLKDNNSITQNTELYYWHKRPFSAQFYSKGQAQLLDKKEQLVEVLLSNKEIFIVIRQRDFDLLQDLLSPVCLINKETERSLLLKCN